MGSIFSDIALLFFLDVLDGFSSATLRYPVQMQFRGSITCFYTSTAYRVHPTK